LEDNSLSLAIIATIIIAILSLGNVPKLNLGIKLEISDKYLHTLAYFTLTLVWYFALQEKIKKTSFKYYVIISLIIYGIILEALQGGITNYRTADIYDVLANIIGIVLGSIIFKKIIKWYRTI
jgi:VanZ family protein